MLMNLQGKNKKLDKEFVKFVMQFKNVMNMQLQKKDKKIKLN